MNLFRNRSLAFKIAFPILVVIGVSLFFLLYNMRLAGEIRSNSLHVEQHDLPAYQLLTSNLMLLDRIVENMQFAVSTQETEWIVQSERHAEKILNNLETLERQKHPWLDPVAMNRTFRTYFDTVRRFSFSLSGAAQTENPIDQEKAREVIRLYNETAGLFRSAFRAAEGELNADLGKSTSRAADMVRNESIFLAALLIAFLFTRRYTVRHVLKPLARLMEGTRIIGEGDYRHVIGLKTGDEMEELAESFNGMTGRLDRSIREIRHQQEELAASNKTLAELNAGLEEKVAEKVTELREKDELLIRQSRSAALGEMISMIAHQWRQPLNAISAAAVNIRLRIDMGNFSEEKGVEKSRFIEEQARRMSETINDFATFFKPDKEEQPFPLQICVEKACSIIRAQLEAHSIRIEINVPPEITLVGVANQLEHVILNLLSNARDALKEAGGEKRITVTAAATGQEVEIRVGDTGGGVPEEIMEKIFDPYFTTKHASVGTGIGLYMTQTIIEQHFNGSIAVRNVGGGAEFILKLPVGEASKKEMSDDLKSQEEEKKESLYS